ncbi:MAG: trigger factor [Flavobacteriales bacterium]|nr:trigger factor [Flavobacteriales bacterium]
MEVVRKDIDKLNAEITIKINEADYKDKVDTALKTYRKQAALPGFRKGMVPMGMVKKMVGTNILVDEINKTLSDHLHQYINDNKLDLLGNPLPKANEDEKIDWETQKDFEFTYEIGLSPEVNVSLTEKDKFEKHKVKISDKLIEDQIQEIAKRYGKMEEADVSKAEDMLYGKFDQIEKGEIKEGGISNGTVLNISTIAKDKDKKQFVGLKPGATVDCKPQDLAADNYVAAWLGVDKSLVKDIKDEFRFTVEKIHRTSPADLNQDFFDKLYGKGLVKSKEELGEKIKAEMEKSFAQSAEQLFERDVQDFLIKNAKLSLPDAFMKKWLLTANEKPITKEQIDSEYEQYALGLKWQLIENKLIKDNKITVTKDEIVNYTIGMIQQQLSGMGQSMMDEAELEETANRVLENQEEARRLYEQLYQLKLRDFYNKTVKIKEKEISYDDFVKLAEKKRN